MSQRIRLAKHIATQAHAGQKRKYNNLPYITHPEEVVRLMVEAGVTDEDTLIAGWLHDVVEDTPFNVDAVQIVFGSKVCALVMEVTEVSKPWMGTRVQRKQLDRIHYSFASPEGMTIKLADMIANSDIIDNDPKFAKIFMREKAWLLSCLIEGNQVLWNKARKIVEDYHSRQSPQDQEEGWLPSHY